MLKIYLQIYLNHLMYNFVSYLISFILVYYHFINNHLYIQYILNLYMLYNCLIMYIKYMYFHPLMEYNQVNIKYISYVKNNIYNCL